MALSLENANLVRQKVKAALDVGVGADPSISEQFKDLFQYLATQRLNPDLQFIPITQAGLVAAAGTALTDAACKLIAVYIKGARTTGTTSSFVSLTTTNQAGEVITSTRFKAIGQKFVWFNPTGTAVETALHSSAATTVGGATESSEADSGNGFAIVAAA